MANITWVLTLSITAVIIQSIAANTPQGASSLIPGSDDGFDECSNGVPELSDRRGSRHASPRVEARCRLRLQQEIYAFRERGETQASRAGAWVFNEGLPNEMPHLATLFAVCVLAGCSSDADIASHNLSQAADNFEISRRIVFYNGITNDYMLTIEGLCSKGNSDAARQLTVTCKVGPGQYKKHFLGLSDNVTYFIEQMEPTAAGTFHYRVIFKPAAIIPDIQIK